ncbi:hypothetical protein SELMODRAFT_409337 [Selaginella moellendorffii]|uniref:Uncharacterized protein n=1 Tax=Selaginella moellendorffii TaxID=88036 RepID=D8RB48_SELML|nr:hypothetical protein SELMODRAFT_409337 [Selaginella moellendorffii]
MEAIIHEKPTSYEEHYEGSRKFRQEMVSWVERDLFGGVGSLEMQAWLVFDAQMLAHEWELVLRSFNKSNSLDRLLRMDTNCSPNIEFDDKMSHEDFDQETYDELVEDLEATKMVGGVEEIIKRYGELKFKPKRNDEYDDNVEDDFSLGKHPNKQQVKYKMTKRGLRPLRRSSSASKNKK